MAADVARKGGQAAATASRWGAAGTLLGGGGSLLISRYGWNQTSSSPTPIMSGRVAGSMSTYNTLPRLG